MPYQVTKHYPHSLGLSCCFRQWRADSHCAQLHGYALAFTIEFEADALNECNWVIDFGGLKPLKRMLEETFDHKLVVAEDDPQAHHLLKLQDLGLADVMYLPNVGAEAFAGFVYDWVYKWLRSTHQSPRVVVKRVTCAEHDANSASFP